MLSTGAGRRQARTWAKAQGGDTGTVMRRFTQDATHLAFARQRVITGRDGIGGRRDEAQLLQAVTADRGMLLSVGAQAPAPQQPHGQQPYGQQTYGQQPHGQQGPPVI
jgi:hypothetical protein